MQQGILCLKSVCEADMGDTCSGAAVAVTFHVEVGGEQSSDQVAWVEQIGDEYGAAGHLKIWCAPIPFGFPQPVVEPYIENYVLNATHMFAGVTLTDMANKVFEMDLRVPIAFKPDQGAVAMASATSEARS